MKFLVISSVFPPDMIGGAEVSASNLARWLASQGHEVHVLTTAKIKEEACEDKIEGSLHMWRVWMPRPYPMFYFARAKGWQKPIWHLQDHFDPRNRAIMAKALDAIKPDFINIHVMQGLGFNALKEIGRRNIPVLHFLPDVALSCIRMSMFKNGKDCVGLCPECKCSRNVKVRYMKSLPRLGFCSPSRFNLGKVTRYFPVEDWLHTSILNANKYPAPTVKPKPFKGTRVLYVGQLNPAKGIDVLLDAVSRLNDEGLPVHLTIAGKGPMEAELKQRYGHNKWASFLGFVNHEDISNHMVSSSVLAIPSVWDENSPGVVIHALGLGLPVLGSNKAGIPELVLHGQNGLLVPPGDVDAWAAAIRTAASSSTDMQKWKKHALANAHKFEQDYLGNRILEFIQRIKG